MRNPNLWAAGLTAAAIILSFSCSKSRATQSAAPAQQAHDTRKLAPNFTLQDAGGSPVKLSDYRGKAVLLNFWATWCGPCAIEIPWFKEFEQQYKSRGFEVLGVSMDEDGWKVVKPYVTEHQINYRIVLGNDSVSQLYGGVESLPTSFIIDRNGKVAFVHVGLAGKNEYLNEIQSVLAAPTTAGPQTALLAFPSALAIRAAK